MMQHCIRCGGQTVTHYDDIKCLQCGHDQKPKVTTPPPVKRVGRYTEYKKPRRSLQERGRASMRYSR